LKRSIIIRKAPTFHEDYHHQISPYEETSQKYDKVRYTLNFVLSYKNLSEKHLNYAFSLSTKTKPQ